MKKTFLTERVNLPLVLVACATLVLFASLTGCSVSNHSAAGNAINSAVSNGGLEQFYVKGALPDMESDYMDCATDAAPAEIPSYERMATTSANTSILNVEPNTTKMVYRADVSMETTEFDISTENVEALIREVKGYTENKNLYNGDSGEYREIYYTARVPAAKFDYFLDQLGTFATVTYQSSRADNISETYYDKESRLETEKIKLNRLQELLAKAEEMEDIIALNDVISSTEYSIESLSGELKHYDALVSYSTVVIELREVYRISETSSVPFTFSERMHNSFVAGLENFREFLEDLAIWFACSWLPLFVFALIVFVVVAIIRKRNGKQSKKNTTEIKALKTDEEIQQEFADNDPSGE